jgi:hypothetical protein
MVGAAALADTPSASWATVIHLDSGQACSSWSDVNIAGARWRTGYMDWR